MTPQDRRKKLERMIYKSYGVYATLPTPMKMIRIIAQALSDKVVLNEEYEALRKRVWSLEKTNIELVNENNK